MAAHTNDPASEAGRVAAFLPGPASPFRNLGRALRLLRELRGRGLKELARELRIGASQLSRYETGKALPKLEAIEKLLRGLKLTPFDFFHVVAFIDSEERSGVSANPVRSAAGPPFPLAGTSLLGNAASRMFGQALESFIAFHAEVIALAVRGHLAETLPAFRASPGPKLSVEMEEKGRITLPEEIRMAAGMHAGDALDLAVIGEAICLTRRSD